MPTTISRQGPLAIAMGNEIVYACLGENPDVVGLDEALADERLHSTLIREIGSKARCLSNVYGLVDG